MSDKNKFDNNQSLAIRILLCILTLLVLLLLLGTMMLLLNSSIISSEIHTVAIASSTLSTVLITCILIVRHKKLLNFKLNANPQEEKAFTLHKPPGENLKILLQTVFSPSTFESIFAQVIADAREEYFDALYEKKFILAFWRKIQLYIEIILTGISLISASSAKKFVSMWKIL